MAAKHEKIHARSVVGTGQEKDRNTMDDRHLCNTCGKTFASDDSLRVHERRHAGKSSYQCCGIRFYDRTHFSRHRCNKHRQERQHECPTCSSKFGTASELSTHNKRVHDDKRFVCTVCSKAFARRSDLDDHIAGHNGEKKHAC